MVSPARYSLLACGRGIAESPCATAGNLAVRGCSGFRRHHFPPPSGVLDASRQVSCMHRLPLDSRISPATKRVAFGSFLPRLHPEVRQQYAYQSNRLGADALVHWTPSWLASTLIYHSTSRQAPRNNLQLARHWAITNWRAFFLCRLPSSSSREATATGSNSSTWLNIRFLNHLRGFSRNHPGRVLAGVVFKGHAGLNFHDFVTKSFDWRCWLAFFTLVSS